MLCELYMNMYQLQTWRVIVLNALSRLCLSVISSIWPLQIEQFRKSCRFQAENATLRQRSCRERIITMKGKPHKTKVLSY